MSHFTGLVILTPEYAKTHDLEESLDQYYEGREVEPYKVRDVSDADKVSFISFYLIHGHAASIHHKDDLGIMREFVEQAEFVMPFKDYQKKYDSDDYDRYLRVITMNENKDEFAEFWKNKFPETFADFERLYEEHGEDWNGKDWVKNSATGVWEEWSTYNPYSKWDWFDPTGRWSGFIKTNSGEFVNEAMFGEIDFTDDKRDCFSLKNPPYCVVIDGKWYEKGQMGWWGISTGDKENWDEEFAELIANIPADSEVYNIDFHI
jgi:hypothetical protein